MKKIQKIQFIKKKSLEWNGMLCWGKRVLSFVRHLYSDLCLFYCVAGTPIATPPCLPLPAAGPPLLPHSISSTLAQSMILAQSSLLSKS